MKRRRRRNPVDALPLLALAGAAWYLSTRPRAPGRGGAGGAVPGRLIAGLNPELRTLMGSAAELAEGTIRQAGGTVIQIMEMQPPVFVIAVPVGAEDKIATQLRGSGVFRYVERDQIVQAL